MGAMTELNRSLAANVKALRARYGWSQAELAERADLSVSYIGEIEGAAKWPAAEKIDGLARAFHIRPYQLFLDPQDAEAFRAWLEKRDTVQEFSEKVLEYLERKRP